MNKVEAALLHLISAVRVHLHHSQIPHEAKAAVTAALTEATDAVLPRLEKGDAPGPSAAIVAASEAANKTDPDSVAA